jgi:NDP-sugar pyrophosphorylase family protein
MSWKTQGSISKIENNSTLAVNNLIVDSFILKNIYRGQWDICGGLMVRDDSILMGNVYIYEDANISGNVNIGGSLNVLDTNIIGNVYVS